DEIGPAVLEVEVVGVLPHIAGQERGLAFGQRVDGIRRPGDRELAAACDEPGPAAAELADCRRLEIVLELGEAAEVAVDRLGEVAARGAATLRLHAVPEEGMVPHLGGVVEDAGLGGILGGRLDGLLERLALPRRAFGGAGPVGYIGL